MRIISGTIVPAKLAPEPTAVTKQFWNFNIVKHNEQFRKKNSKKRVLLSLVRPHRNEEMSHKGRKSRESFSEES